LSPPRLAETVALRLPERRPMSLRLPKAQKSHRDVSGRKNCMADRITQRQFPPRHTLRPIHSNPNRKRRTAKHPSAQTSPRDEESTSANTRTFRTRKRRPVRRLSGGRIMAIRLGRGGRHKGDGDMCRMIRVGQKVALTTSISVDVRQGSWGMAREQCCIAKTRSHRQSV
jgi:hypothetical protein